MKSDGCILLLWALDNGETPCDSINSHALTNGYAHFKCSREKPAGSLCIYEDGLNTRELGILTYVKNLNPNLRPLQDIYPYYPIHQLSFLSSTADRHSTTNPWTQEPLKCLNSLDQLCQVQDGSIIVVLDELNESVMSHLEPEHWDILQTLITKKLRTLWVTKGGQFHANQPDRALINGFARTLRAEDPSTQFVVLDVQCESSAASRAAIDKLVLHFAHDKKQLLTDSEYVERDSLLYISRVQPDNILNPKEEESTHIRKPVSQALHEHKSCVRLMCTQPGNLGSLEYAEVSPKELALGIGEVEVEIYAASLNFKVRPNDLYSHRSTHVEQDVVVALGLVPADPNRLGLEAGGTVRRLGSGVTHLCVGQRVLVSRKGCFANRVQCPVEAVHPIPDDLTFEVSSCTIAWWKVVNICKQDAATLPVVYLVTLYGLVDLANVQPGQVCIQTQPKYRANQIVRTDSFCCRRCRDCCIILVSILES